MWFKKLTGFREISPNNVRENLTIENDAFVSKINNRKFSFGALQISTLNELKQLSPAIETFNDKISVNEIVADVQTLHSKIENTNAIFQAASQFNLLEMVGPNVTPEQGIDKYENDQTQGPACAIACGAGTIYRNYFVKLENQIGQTAEKQIDCLELIGKQLNNEALNLWQMQNGYALVNQAGILEINKQLAKLNFEEREHLKAQLKVGIQWNTEVTIAKTRHKVTQVYCSTLPVAYSLLDSIYWESFARVILEATYEATLYAALINYQKTKCRLVYLTLVGGGAFGNDEDWILESLMLALKKFKNTPLNIKVVSLRNSNEYLVDFLNEI